MTTDHTIESAREHVMEALKGFVNDPADSDYQKGYLAALYEIGVHGLGMDLLTKTEPAHTKPTLRIVKSEN